LCCLHSHFGWGAHCLTCLSHTLAVIAAIAVVVEGCSWCPHDLVYLACTSVWCIYCGCWTGAAFFLVCKFLWPLGKPLQLLTEFGSAFFGENGSEGTHSLRGCITQFLAYPPLTEYIRLLCALLIFWLMGVTVSVMLFALAVPAAITVVCFGRRSADFVRCSGCAVLLCFVHWNFGWVPECLACFSSTLALLVAIVVVVEGSWCPDNLVSFASAACLWCIYCGCWRGTVFFLFGKFLWPSGRPLQLNLQVVSVPRSS